MVNTKCGAQLGVIFLILVRANNVTSADFFQRQIVSRSFEKSGVKLLQLAEFDVLKPIHILLNTLYNLVKKTLLYLPPSPLLHTTLASGYSHGVVGLVPAQQLLDGPRPPGQRHPHLLRPAPAHLHQSQLSIVSINQ